MTLPIDRTPVLKTALSAWDALNPGDPIDDIEAAGTGLAEAARILVSTPDLEHALDDWSNMTGETPTDVVQRSAARLQEAAAAFAPSPTSPFTRLSAPLKDPILLAREAMDRSYGIGTDWEEPNEHGEEGFTRAQAESDIDADEIIAVIASAIEADRAQRARRFFPGTTSDSEGVIE